ncbi:MAG: YeeE/YedE thiosulfate transporter family protein [Ignavibacteriaceae bacterium]|nr:YeeE/YedE thiosulfate transporter family protein [Ignavibacteriaceae bacterium]
MGPLVPEVIGNELNFIVALLAGIAFGFVLEQAGFSTSKKLVGLFYGYDFTVLRVFFTGGVTAMLGVITLAHFGLLDMKLVYVNPTFLWSAIVGGLIMGLGFVTGGYCPGTSICAAAIGKIDAMIFIGGSFLGVLVFAEGYPLFEGLYKAASWGNVQAFETLGISQSLFAFLLTFIAVAAFWFTAAIERRVNGKTVKGFHLSKVYLGLTGLAIIIGLTAFMLPDKKEYMLKDLADNNFVASFKIEGMDADELAFRLIDNDNDLQIIDLRSQKDFDSLSLPKSTHFMLENMFEKDAYKLLSVKHKKNVFIANDELTAKSGAVLASELGFSNILVLKGGFAQFKKDILEFVMPAGTIDRKDADTFRFRTNASEVMPVLIKENKLKQSSGKKVQVKRVLGGC